MNTLGEAGKDSSTMNTGLLHSSSPCENLALWDVLVSLSNYHPLNTCCVFVVTHLYNQDQDLIFAFTLQFKQMALVMRSCFLCPMNTTSLWLTQERGRSKSRLAVRKCRGLLKFCVLEEN